jgi:hypothetical protein
MDQKGVGHAILVDFFPKNIEPSEILQTILIKNSWSRHLRWLEYSNEAGVLLPTKMT